MPAVAFSMGEGFTVLPQKVHKSIHSIAPKPGPLHPNYTLIHIKIRGMLWIVVDSRFPAARQDRPS